MAIKRAIRASEAIQDIRGGMSNHALMLKYRLAPQGLRSLLRKLVHAGVLTSDEKDVRESNLRLQWMEVLLHQARKSCPAEMFPIYDISDSNSELLMKDLSEQILQVIGTEAAIGDRRVFLVQASTFHDIDPLILEAYCRWIRQDVDDMGETISISGFEIVGLDEVDVLELKKFVDAISRTG